MNKKLKPLIYISIFVLFMVVAVIGYNYLTEQHRAPSSLKPSPSANNDEVGNKEPVDLPKTSPTETTPGEPGGSGEPGDGTGESGEPGDGTGGSGDGTGDSGDESEEPIQYADFTVQDYDGNSVMLSDYIGTPIVLNFWASWCPPCKEEMPDFNKVSEEYPRDELLFLMIDLAEGNRETVEMGKKYVEDNNFTFTVLFDTEQDAAANYGVRSIPTTYFINKEGHIITGAEGMIDEETLRYAVSLIME